MITSSFPGVLDLVFWIFIYTVIGMNFYLIDTKIGIAIHNWIKKMTSEDSSKYIKVNEGFVYNRKLKSKIFHATWISALLSVTVVWQGHSSIAVEIVMFTIEIPILIFGFFIGPFYLKLLRISETAIEHYDKFETKIENTDIIEEAKKTINETTNDVKDSINETTNDIIDGVSNTYEDMKNKILTSEEKEKKEKRTLEDANSNIDDILGINNKD